MTIGIADELLLLAYDDKGEPETGQPALDFSLSGAVLTELTFAGRIRVDDKVVQVLDRTPTGDPVIDAALNHITADERSRTPGHWIRKLAEGLRDHLLDRQVAAGVLRRAEGKVLWVFRHTSFPPATGTTPAPELAARRRLEAALDGTEPVDPRTAALCGLVLAAGLAPRLFPGRPHKAVQDRLRQIADGDWASAAARSAIAQVQAAITVAVTTAATSAAFTAGS